MTCSWSGCRSNQIDDDDDEDDEDDDEVFIPLFFFSLFKVFFLKAAASPRIGKGRQDSAQSGKGNSF